MRQNYYRTGNTCVRINTVNVKTFLMTMVQRNSQHCLAEQTWNIYINYTIY